MLKKRTEVKTPPKTGPDLWLEYAKTARERAAKQSDPVDRAWEMIEALRCEVKAEGVKSFVNNSDGSPWYDDPERSAKDLVRRTRIVREANEFAVRYPNGKSLEELNAELRAYLGELIAKLS